MAHATADAFDLIGDHEWHSAERVCRLAKAKELQAEARRKAAERAEELQAARHTPPPKGAATEQAAAEVRRTPENVVLDLLDEEACQQAELFEKAFRAAAPPAAAAPELEAVCSRHFSCLVSQTDGDEETDPWKVIDYARLSCVLWRTCQALDTRVTQLEAQLVKS